MSSSIQYSFQPGLPTNAEAFLRQTICLLGTLRNISFHEKPIHSLSNGDDGAHPPSIVEFSLSSGLEDCLRVLCDALFVLDREREAEVLQHVLELAQSDKELGGLGINSSSPSNPWPSSAQDLDDVMFLVEAWLEALNSADTSRRLPGPVTMKDHARRPMTLSEKIFAHHATRVSSPVGVKPGDFIRVSVDWVIASELSWVGMKQSLVSIRREPTVWRNDRFWLAGDHVVEPRTYEQPRVRELIEGMAQAKKSFKMTENQGSNYTILHTEFVRERAEPGMLVLGSDSHTCSGGAVSCLAIGLGAADVMMALVTGETWFKVPECINIRFVNQPAWYINGKDTILYILKKLKRNTVAADRIVEFSGPGVRYLSCDSRFAISNMVTELGGITGIFVPDEVTHSYVNARPRKANKSSSLYFRADDEAQYAGKFEIDLAKVESFIALYPSPDNVVSLAEKTGMNFDGCFIGACTTTEEELILAALVLQVGLQENLPLAPGKRKVVPGSLPIVNTLKKFGLFDVYKDAGFDRPAPGCSLCLGMAADRAEAGEVWLSSQNRNFQNRMGKGSIGNICSAATVAASSFSMTLTDPRPFLAKVKPDDYAALLKSCQTRRKTSYARDILDSSPPLTYVEPYLAHKKREPEVKTVDSSENELKASPMTAVMRGKAYVLGDFVDTDAIIPADQIVASPTDELLGSHCLEYTNPDFRQKVREGHDIVVAGKAFGCGSSREEAPRALKGLGVKCVIARSFSFIYGRNQPNIALLGIITHDDDFYARATPGVDIEVIMDRRVVVVDGKHEYSFELDEMELRLIERRGLAKAFLEFGGQVFQSLCGEAPEPSRPEKWAERVEEGEREGVRNQLAW